MTGNRLSEHFEVEIALLAGVLGFFIGGIVSIKKEILDIAVIAVTSGVMTFFVSYYAVKLVFLGKDGHDKGASASDGFMEEKEFPRVEIKKKNGVTGKKIDIKTPDDDLYDDIYGKK